MIAIGFPNDATPLGSTAYYVTRFSPDAQQDDLAALFLLKQELNKLYGLSDPGVARIKLQWWQQQIALPLDTPSNHPLAARISQLFHSGEQASSVFTRLVSALDEQLHRQPYADTAAFWQACQDIGGSFLQLLFLLETKFESNLERYDQQALAQLGAWCTFTEWLQDMGRLAREDVRLLPVTALKQQGLGFDNLLQSANQPAVQALLGALLEELESSQTMPKLPRRKSALSRYVRLRFKLLKLLKQEQFDVLNQRISLTPIRKLWVAW